MSRTEYDSTDIYNLLTCISEKLDQIITLLKPTEDEIRDDKETTELLRRQAELMEKMVARYTEFDS